MSPEEFGQVAVGIAPHGDPALLSIDPLGATQE